MLHPSASHHAEAVPSPLLLLPLPSPEVSPDGLSRATSNPNQLVRARQRAAIHNLVMREASTTSQSSTFTSQSSLYFPSLSSLLASPLCACPIDSTFALFLPIGPFSTSRASHNPITLPHGSPNFPSWQHQRLEDQPSTAGNWLCDSFILSAYIGPAATISSLLAFY